MRPKTLLIDLDGTLLGAHSLSLSLSFIRFSLQSLGKRFSYSRAFRTLWGARKELLRIAPEFSERNDVRTIREIAKQLGISISEAEKVSRETLVDVFPRLEPHFFPISGAKEFIDWAKVRFPLVLATNPVWPPFVIEWRVKWAGLSPEDFQEITHVQRMHSSKPNPSYYRELLRQIGARPEDTLMIGDDLTNDLVAREVGIPVFILDLNRHQFDRFSEVPGCAPAFRGSYSVLRKEVLASF